MTNEALKQWRESGAEHAFTAAVGTPSEVCLLSNTNNNVWKASASGASYVVKEVTDPTVDVESEARLLSLINDNKRFRPMIYHQIAPQTGARIAIYPFLEGQSLDAIDFRNEPTEVVARWADQLHESFELIRTAEQVHGFGRTSVGKSPDWPTWMDFIYWYLDNQATKGPRMAQLRYEVIKSAFDCHAEEIASCVLEPSLVCGDVNLRNYIITPDNNLVCIHSPMLWHGDPAVSYGDAAVHLDSSELGELFIKRGGFPDSRIHLYAAFSAFAILVYIERFGDEPLEKALCWGGMRPLLTILDEHLDKLER